MERAILLIHTVWSHLFPMVVSMSPSRAVPIPGCPGRGRFRVQRCLWGATFTDSHGMAMTFLPQKWGKKTCFDRGIDVCFYVYCFWPLPETIPTLYTYEYSDSLQILQFGESVQEYRMNLLSHVIRHALAVQISQGFALARGLRGRDRISQGTHWAIDPWTSGCSCHTFSWQNDTDGKSANPSMLSWWMISIWDTTSWCLMFALRNCLAWFRDGAGFVTGGEDGYVRVHHFDKDYFTAKRFE